MSDASLDLCLADICRGPRAADFEADPVATLADYDLAPDARDEVLRGDVRALLARGAHPMLVMYLARRQGLIGPSYVAEVAAT